MYPTHPTDKNNINNNSNPSLSNSPSSINTSPPTRHGRKLSHVQFGKKSYTQGDEYASSMFMIPFDDLHQKLPIGGAESTHHILHNSGSGDPHHKASEAAAIVGDEEKPTPPTKRILNWLFTTINLGPFTKGDHWPLFTYLTVAFTIVIFSGELLQSKLTSGGEFFELEPFNYMLGPSIEIMIQTGARFSPCMRHVDSMSSEQRYICLKTFQEPLIPEVANSTIHQSLNLLDPIVNPQDPRFINASCSLSTICGMTAFHQYGKPDQTYRLLTPLFIHTGLIHLCTNMAVLVILGVKVERTVNSLRFSLLYIGSGIFGHALGANLSPPTAPFLGCSSSLFGLIGFLYVDLILNWKSLEQPISNLIKLAVVTAFTFILGLLPGVDTFSHVGGLVAGILLGVFLLPVNWWLPANNTIDAITTRQKKWIIELYGMRIMSICIYGALMSVLIYQFSINKLDQVCPLCKYISCLPMNGFCD